MFKPLIKKVREESTNSSILPENNSDEINGSNNGFDDENSSSSRNHRRSNSNAQQTVTNKPRTLSSDKKEESVKFLSDIFSPYIEEPISINNYLQTLKSWMDSKEEILREKDDIIQSLTEETNNVQNEMTALRNKLADVQSSREENTNKPSYLQKSLDTLRSDNENLKSTIKSLRTKLSAVEAERDDLVIESTNVSNNDLQRQLDRQKLENEQQKIELEKLRQNLLERDMIIEQQDKRLLVDHETQAIQTDEDTSFVQVLAEPDVDTISKLQAELEDKNRANKMLQQRYNDLRKTLQREFHASIPKDLNQMGPTKTNSNSPSSPTNLPLIHYDPSATSQSDVDVAKRESTARQMSATRKNVTFTTTTIASSNSAVLPHTSVEPKPQKNGHRPSIDGQAPANGTNFKYLKHVLLKFMTSTEEEAIHLIRAVSTLLNFSADEERLLRQTLDYKMSWFGKVSRVKPL